MGMATACVIPLGPCISIMGLGCIGICMVCIMAPGCITPGSGGGDIIEAIGTGVWLVYGSKCIFLSFVIRLMAEDS